jgi:glycosyltransferase involved in cell wall biosynthesis
MKENKVSIVITAYNVAEYLEKTVFSAVQQGVKEVIIVEDCSTDNTKDVIAELVMNLSSIVKVIYNRKNIGAGLSRRVGIENATGEYVLLLDGDDYLDEGYIKALLDRAEEIGADIVSSGIKIIQEDGTWKAESYGNATTVGNEKISRYWGERIVFMNNKLIRRSLYEKVPYNHRRYIEDTPTIIPILWYANKCEYVDMLGYNYVMRQTSLTHTTNQLKDVVFKGLCWLDLMDFFNANDKGVFEHIPIKGYLKNIFSVLNTIKIKPEDIEPFKEEWCEFMMRLVNGVVVQQVNFKEMK